MFIATRHQSEVHKNLKLAEMKVLLRLIATTILFARMFAEKSYQDKPCTTRCPLIYSPVCGTDGDSIQIFTNWCFFNSANCDRHMKSQPEFVQTNLKNCQGQTQTFLESEECPIVCSYIYDPVCATNSKKPTVFPNKCQLQIAQCRMGEHWEQIDMELCAHSPLERIGEDLQKKCRKPCFLNWDPVCGFDGVNYATFGNKCDYEVQNCLSGGKRWSIIREDECTN